MNRIEIKEQAKKLIAGNLWTLWKPFLVVAACSFVLSICAAWIPIVGGFLSLAIAPLSIGLLKYYLAFIRGQEFSINTLYSSYKDIILIVLVSLLIVIFTWLWSLLLIIPGIIAAFSYSQASYILADNKDTNSPTEIINRSKELMATHKMDLFIFNLSFIGWFMLGSITLGLAYIYVIPYYQVANTIFYDKLLKEKK